MPTCHEKTTKLNDINDIFEEFFDTDLNVLAENLGQLMVDCENLKEDIFSVIVDFFTSDDWPFQKNQGEPVLYTSFQGESGKWNCFAKVVEDRCQLVFYSVYCDKIPRSERNIISEFITCANYGMILGNFELDYSDGEIRYKTSIDVENDRLTPALIQNLVYTNVMTMDQYLPGLLAVLEQNATPDQAIRLVEQGQPIPNTSSTSPPSSVHKPTLTANPMDRLVW